MTFKNFIKKLYPYLKPHIWKLIVVSITMALATSLEASLPEITGRIIDNLFNPNTTNNTIFSYTVLVFLVIFLSSVFNFIATNASSWVSNKVVMDIRIDMFNKLLKLPKRYFDKNPTGKTISKLLMP